ncbi:UDP-N-acetylglucosamine 2-epimerase [Dyadobacter psychrophilus]|uniref:UDP-N-acetylglucosamine 2-epimerase/UDP-N-acetyl-D-glucosamine 2-epimerase, UDP-hydrolysing,TIGR03568 n=1 Tax=Dyadobacter psychrophilus TaxID=651661 RepID=A0A1T5HBM3_9BACT|nr:UDP-N-acetylglucosamine 2-epimerase [Dyadobacter psychrophilus]SKC18078.1 UDP-N-acetylglucosamine 2-epimerase/UDP-N-acetyl-D-glucosamine 2-epimerase, UDP-hydrolysing,TIGR03568 [Dyadobacter psychrophilus]
MKRKICVVITARASYSRVKTLLIAIKSHPSLCLQLVITGSCLLEKYGGLTKLVNQDGFDPIIKVSNLLENENPTAAAKTTGLGVIELASVFENVRPDVVVTVADRYETMSAAVAASFMNIPLAHVQGGEVTGNIDEKVRHAVSKLADVHFVATASARNRLIAMGEVPENVWHTGCPSIDLAIQIKNDAAMRFDYESCQSFSSASKYIVVMHHPVTTEHGFTKDQFCSLVNAISALHIPTFWFTPNPDYGAAQILKEIQRYGETSKNLKIHFLRNLNPESFLKLIKHCACLIGNSSTGIREASLLGTPVVNIGSRQQGRERSFNVIDVDFDSNAIIEAVQNQLDHGHYDSSILYGNGDAGNQIADLLAKMKLSVNKQITY